MSDTTRRLDGWGFVDVEPEVPQRMLDWLGERVEAGPAQPRLDLEAYRAPPARDVPELGPVDRSDGRSDDGVDRLRHARGQGLADLVRLRHASTTAEAVPRLPDIVARPGDDGEVETLLQAASASGVRVIPWGGGTSVTGGVVVPPDDVPTVTVDLGRLDGLHELDEVSGLATFGSGTVGPALEGALEGHGFDLGHYPQSFELSTLGGWIAAHSSGQESLGRGRIADLVAGLDAVTPTGRLELPPLPASAGGPDLRQLFVGSEGRFGVITRATVRVRRRVEAQSVEAVLVPDWATGVDAARKLLDEGVALSMLRLSDEPETEVALAVGLAKSRLGGLKNAYLKLRGVDQGCLLLLGARGDATDVEVAFEEARLVLRDTGAVWLGAGPGRNWRRDRFKHPYLRDALLDRGYATETLETAAPWSRLRELYEAVGTALRDDPVANDGRPVPVLCHLSHPYRDGASLYFTVFFPCGATLDETIARWASLKRRAADAIASVSAATSHHHGVGSWHGPWLGREIGPLGVRTLQAVARELDPNAILNPHVLLDPTDRLED